MPASRVDFDAIIAGGGPAGATAAILLARAGWRVAIVERKRFPRRKVCGEFVSATTWPLLRAVGVAGSLEAQAGPEVVEVGLFAGDATLCAPMPSPRTADGAGRALGRDLLDTALLERAGKVGAELFQPWALTNVARIEGGYRCTVVDQGRGDESSSAGAVDIDAPIVIAAHGSWEPGSLPTQFRRLVPRPSDLFAFKARFVDAQLPAGLMPLLMFPGGYGGMVETDGGRVSLSCCIRRDMLETCRRQQAGDGASPRAGDAVLAHIRASCLGVRKALRGATLDGAWLAAGPIRPGIRHFARGGIFAVGNAAGEAHPIIAEGISMAIQSSWLLCERLIAQHARRPRAVGSSNTALAQRYQRDWRANFATRIRAAALFAHLAMRPRVASTATVVSQYAPAMLTLGARLSGKARPLERLRPS